MQLITGDVNCQPVSTVCLYFDAVEKKISAVVWENRFCVVVCLHVHGEVRHFGYMRHIIHFWLVWYKNYRNWSRFGKVVTKSLLPHVYGPHCSYCEHSLSSHVCVAAVLFILLNYTKFIVIIKFYHFGLGTESKRLFPVNLSVWLLFCNVILVWVWWYTSHSSLFTVDFGHCWPCSHMHPVVCSLEIEYFC